MMFSLARSDGSAMARRLDCCAFDSRPRRNIPYESVRAVPRSMAKIRYRDRVMRYQELTAASLAARRAPLRSRPRCRRPRRPRRGVRAVHGRVQIIPGSTWWLSTRPANSSRRPDAPGSAGSREKTRLWKRPDLWTRRARAHRSSALSPGGHFYRVKDGDISNES